MGYVKIEAIALLLAACVPAAAYSQSRQLPPGAFAENVEFISFTDLNGHIPFKMSIHQANGRWYMYAGAQDDRGWSVLDITNPASPTVLNWIPGPKNTRTVQVEIAEGKMITALEKSQRGGDTDPNAPYDEGVLIWSLEDRSVGTDYGALQADSARDADDRPLAELRRPADALICHVLPIG